MQNAVTYQDMYLSLPGFLHMRKLKIVEEPGRHSEMYVEAVMDPKLGKEIFYELPASVSLKYSLDGRPSILFQGVVSSSSLHTDGGNFLLEMEVKDATYWMDLDRKNRCFQNVDRPASSVMDEIMKGYEGGAAIWNISDEPIGELIFQYEETDWEFLNRFLSKYLDSLYPAAAYETIHFQAGVAAQDIPVDWDLLPYEKRKDFSQCARLKQNGFPELLSAQFAVCHLESHDVAALGSRVLFKGRYWYIAKIDRELRNGLLVNVYDLKQKEAMTAERYYNPRLTGISQYAVVTGVRRDRVQVAMQQDLLRENCYWFSYSSVSSSSDGSGWYCMPEKNESVRVYFPTENEKDAYVITSVQGHAPGGEGDPMGNPGVRSISTAAGNLIQFQEDGILIASKKGNASVSLKKDGEVIVSGPAGIELSPEESCCFSAKTIDCEAAALLSVHDDSGAQVTVNQSGIFLSAQEIYEN